MNNVENKAKRVLSRRARTTIACSLFASAAFLGLLAASPAQTQTQGSPSESLLPPIPPEFKPFVDTAKSFVSGYNDASSAIEVVKKIATFIGILPSVEDKFSTLQRAVNLRAAETNWRLDRTDRENRLGTALGATETVMQYRLWNMPVPPSAVENSNTTVKQALMPGQFERAYIENVTGDTINQGECHGPPFFRPCWKMVFYLAGKSRKPPGMYSDFLHGEKVDIVYDWRLGVPQLMNLISLRINVIAAADPAFRERRSVFAEELLGYKTALEKHMQNMREGVQSASAVLEYLDHHEYRHQLYIACADMYTGSSVTAYYDLTKFTADQLAHLALFRNVTEGNFCTIVRDRMPFVEMYQFAQLLDQLANPLKNVTTRLEIGPTSDFLPTGSRDGIGQSVQQLIGRSKPIVGNYIEGPVYLILTGLNPGTQALVNKAGLTANVHPGSPFVVLNIGQDNVLVPGEVAQPVFLKVTSPLQEKINYTIEAMAGGGIP